MTGGFVICLAELDHFQQITESGHTVVGVADELLDEAVIGHLQVIHQLAHQLGHAPELSQTHLIGEHILTNSFSCIFLTISTRFSCEPFVGLNVK